MPLGANDTQVVGAPAGVRKLEPELWSASPVSPGADHAARHRRAPGDVALRVDSLLHLAGVDQAVRRTDAAVAQDQDRVGPATGRGIRAERRARRIGRRRIAAGGGREEDDVRRAGADRLGARDAQRVGRAARRRARAQVDEEARHRRRAERGDDADDRDHDHRLDEREARLAVAFGFEVVCASRPASFASLVPRSRRFSSCCHTSVFP